MIESYIGDVVESLPNCTFNFKSWKKNAVTVIQPHIAKNCTKLFKGDKKEGKEVLDKLSKWKNSLSDIKLLKITQNCAWVKENFMWNFYVTRKEQSFPLAFTLVIYNSVQQIVRFLKVIYRLHNQYCILIDNSASSTFKETIKNIVLCLPNVHLASRKMRVDHGKRSIFQAQLQCFRDLVKWRKELPEPKKWKYNINLCGKELPMATNYEIVSKLMKLNGTMAIQLGLPNSRDDLSRLRGRKVPFNLRYYKNSAYVGMPYDFLEYMFTNPNAIKLRHFFEQCVIPEEHFYSTLAAAPAIPGGFKSKIYNRNPVVISHAIWQGIYSGDGDGKRCKGKVVHEVCISNVRNLPLIMNETWNGNLAFFYNKYFMAYDHTLMDCMEEELIARNKKEFLSDCG